jgi:metal-responsive CopG/Arc/MetJ family transcriptional regulator
MSDKTHQGKTLFNAWVDEKLYAEFAQAIKAQGYNNRSEWLRAKMREEVRREDKG